jgi:hypothetical protein
MFDLGIWWVEFLVKLMKMLSLFFFLLAYNKSLFVSPKQIFYKIACTRSKVEWPKESISNRNGAKSKPNPNPRSKIKEQRRRGPTWGLPPPSPPPAPPWCALCGRTGRAERSPDLHCSPAWGTGPQAPSLSRSTTVRSPSGERAHRRGASGGAGHHPLHWLPWSGSLDLARLQG